MASKAETFLGFAIRSGNAIFGTDNVENFRKKLFVIVFDRTLSDNAIKKIIKIKEKQGCPLLVTDGLEDILHRPGCKVVAVKDEALAQALLAVEDDRFEQYAGGNK